MTERLPMNADTYEEVLQYYTTRAKQMAHEGVRWSGKLLPVEDYAFQTLFTRNDVVYQSAYILNRFRGQGKIKNLLSLPVSFITVKDCGVTGVFEKLSVPYLEVQGVLNTPEYQAIEKEYGNRKAERSQVFLMNHIDEGLTILTAIGASEAAKRAYCLHPLLQNDHDLIFNYQNITATMPAHHVMLAMEYRSVANEYLSHNVDLNAYVKPIRLSPIKDVNDMLIADKVQNCKDFERYHKGTHPRTEYLERYFEQWLYRLGVGYRYQELCELIK